MKALSIAVAVAFLGASATCYAQTTYSTPGDAAKHCRSPVVWLNTKTGVYHMPGSKDYGATKDGAFVCQAAANRAGDRPALNGQ